MRGGGVNRRSTQVWYSNSIWWINATTCALDFTVSDQTTLQTLKCANSPGVGVNYHFVVEVDGIQSAMSTEVLSYDTPTLTGFSGPNATFNQAQLDTRGGEIIYILGRNFGTDTSALKGVSHHAPFNASMVFFPHNCTATNNEMITCLTAPGAGVGHEWNVTVGSQVRWHCVASLSQLPLVAGVVMFVVCVRVAGVAVSVDFVCSANCHKPPRRQRGQFDKLLHRRWRFDRNYGNQLRVRLRRLRRWFGALVMVDGVACRG